MISKWLRRRRLKNEINIAHQEALWEEGRRRNKLKEEELKGKYNDLKTWTVRIHFRGYVEPNFWAESEEEALEKAKEYWKEDCEFVLFAWDDIYLRQLEHTRIRALPDPKDIGPFPI